MKVIESTHDPRSEYFDLMRRESIPADELMGRRMEIGVLAVLGRALGAIVVREGLRQSLSEFPDPDEATLKMVRVALREGPVRALVLLSGGTVTFPAVDAILATLNGNWSAARSTIKLAPVIWT